MSYRQNENKMDMINRFGETYGLPLFTQPHPNPSPKERGFGDNIKLPDWIWNGSDIKAAVYNAMKDQFAEDAFEYLKAIIKLGGRATDHDVKEYFKDVEKWPLHIVAARRNYFTGSPYYLIESFPGQNKIGPKGKPNTIWFVNFKNLYTLTNN